VFADFGYLCNGLVNVRAEWLVWWGFERLSLVGKGRPGDLEDGVGNFLYLYLLLLKA
jgi:hypothetical protein